MGPITLLPDLCLLSIFKPLPLKDQIRAHQVCFRWRQMMTEATGHVRSLTLLLGAGSLDRFADRITCKSFLLRKGLKLVTNEDGSLMYPLRSFNVWNSLQYDYLDEDIVEQIAATFAKITLLEVVIIDCTSNELHYLGILLKRYLHKLVSFKLYESLGDNSSYFASNLMLKMIIGRLFEVINSMSALQSLTLDMDNVIISQSDLSVISELDSFTYYPAAVSVKTAGSSDSSRFVKLLRQYAVNSDVRILYGVPQLRRNIELFYGLSDHLRGRLDFNSTFHPTGLVDICNRFRSLTSFSIHALGNITIRQIFGNLSQLTELIFLKLGIHFDELQADEPGDHFCLPQLPSVKALNLPVIIDSHLNFSLLKIGHTLPNVQVIEIDFCGIFHCSTCDIDIFKCTPGRVFPPENKKADCTRQVTEQLKRDCANLKALITNGQVEQVSAEGELAE